MLLQDFKSHWFSAKSPCLLVESQVVALEITMSTAKNIPCRVVTYPSSIVIVKSPFSSGNHTKSPCSLGKSPFFLGNCPIFPAQVSGLSRALRDRRAWGGWAAGGAKRGAARDAVADDPAVAGGGKLGDRISGRFWLYDWLVVWNMNFMFPYIIYIIFWIIIPTDFHIFQRGRSTTNQMTIYVLDWRGFKYRKL